MRKQVGGRTARARSKEERTAPRSPSHVSHHLARREDQGGRLGVPDAHDDGRETLKGRGEKREWRERIAAPVVAGAGRGCSFFSPLPRPASLAIRHAHISLSLSTLTLGLYSALRACRAMFFKSSLQSRLTVATTFWRVGTMPDGWRARSTASGAREEGPGASIARWWCWWCVWVGGPGAGREERASGETAAARV